MTSTSRRNMLLGSAAALTLAACGTPNPNGPPAVDPLAGWTNFIDQVTQIVAKGCGVVQGFIPTANTILGVVAGLFPGVGTAVAGIAGSVIGVANTICTAIINSPVPPAKLQAAILKATPLTPVIIGTVQAGNVAVVVHGYNAKYGPQRVTHQMLRAHGLVH